MKRRTAREKALQALFQIEVSEIEPQEALQNVLEEEPSDEYLTGLVTNYCEHKEKIDEMIKNNLERWSFERLARVDRNILRMAVSEILHNEDTPVKVTINEAIEIAKIYGDENSSKFINAVLSKVNTQMES